MLLPTVSKSRTLTHSPHFDCAVCQQLAVDAIECQACGTMYCLRCMGGAVMPRWACIRGCPLREIRDIPRALEKVFSELMVRCVNFEVCGRVLQYGDLEVHQKGCGDTTCDNWRKCGNRIFKRLGDQTHLCSDCLQKQKPQPITDIFSSLLTDPTLPHPLSPSATPTFTFLRSLTHPYLTPNQNTVTVSSHNQFTTAIATPPLVYGRHAWRVEILEKCVGIVVGVVMTREVDLARKFTNSGEGGGGGGGGGGGFGFDGKGRLEEWDGERAATSWIKYGGKYGRKKGDVVTVYVDMHRGMLTFTLGNKFCGIAKMDPSLINGQTVYPCISLRTSGSCRLTPCPIPTSHSFFT